MAQGLNQAANRDETSLERVARELAQSNARLRSLVRRVESHADELHGATPTPISEAKTESGVRPPILTQLGEQDSIISMLEAAVGRL